MLPHKFSERAFDFGPHRAVLEEDDIFVITLRGFVRVADAERFALERAAPLVQLRYVRVLIDIRALTGLEPGARRILASVHETRPQVSACVGGNFAFRTVGELIAKARLALFKKNLTVRFFSDEAPARLWLGEMKSALDDSTKDAPHT